MIRTHKRQQVWRDKKQALGMRQVNFWLSEEDKEILISLALKIKLNHGEVIGLACRFAHSDSHEEFLRFIADEKEENTSEE